MKEIREETELGINPFLAQFVIPVTKKVAKGDYTTVKDEDGNSMLLPKELLLESRIYTRVYATAVQRDLLMESGANTNKLYNWIVYKIGNSSDHLLINKKLFMSKTGMSPVTYNKCVAELCKLSIITPTYKKDTYWINPAWFFKGNPINTFPDKVVIRYDSTKDN